jgi:hypothetical protein
MGLGYCPPPGRVEDPDLVISLCAACHARMHRLTTIPARVTAEVRPNRPFQFQFGLAA